MRRLELFQFVSNALLHKKPNEQLVIYLGREGGTGKSRVVEAWTRLFECLNIIEKLKKLAYTATASHNINGRTVDSQLCLGKGKKRNAKLTSLTVKDSLKAKWGNVTMQIIDEVSFCPLSRFERLDEVQREVKNIDVAFGGIITVLVGDFYQHLSIEKRIYQGNNWKSLLDHSFILTEQMRAAEDPEFRELLQRARYRSCSLDDYNTLQQRRLDLHPNLFHEKNLDDIQFICPTKELGFHLNNLMLSEHARQRKVSRILISSKDTIEKQRIHNSSVRDFICRNYSIPRKNRNLYRIIQVALDILPLKRSQRSSTVSDLFWKDEEMS
jgi:hypothetical protein